MSRLVLTTIALLALVIAGCSANDEATSGSPAMKSPAAAARSKPDVPRGSPQDKLVVRDLVEGSGAVGRNGDIFAVHYVAGIYERGDEIESAWVKGDPFTFKLGGGYVVAGWEEGLKGMKVGGRRELVFPTTPEDAPIGSELGETLVYIIDLIAIHRKPS